MVPCHAAVTRRGPGQERAHIQWPCSPIPAPAGSPLQLQGPPGSADAAALRKQDLQAAALLLAELLSAGLATQAGGAGWLDPSTLQRLLFDVFHEDIAQFKAYCQEVWGQQGLGQGDRRWGRATGAGQGGRGPR